MIFKKKEILKLNVSFRNFEKKCYIENDILSKKNLFLCVYEQRDKFRYYVIKKGVQGKNNVMRDLS